MLAITKYKIWLQIITFYLSPKKMNTSPSSDFLKKYKAKGKRRVNHSLPDQQQTYIDPRNLWKANSITQQKQYQSIRNSGLLDTRRKITFLKFNYRNAEERSLAYSDVYKMLTARPEDYVCRNKIRVKKAQKGLLQFSNRVSEQVKQNIFEPVKDWLKEYHESDCPSAGSRARSRNLVNQKKMALGLGTMNVNQLWGQKQLQESLGYLPCQRDRPKMLKFYSNTVKRKKTSQGVVRCKTDYF